MTTLIGKYGIWSTFNLTNLVKGLIRNPIERSFNPSHFTLMNTHQTFKAMMLQCTYKDVLKKNGVYLILHKAFFNKGSH